MKFQLFLLICIYIHLSKCQDIIKSTNYTLSYFNDINNKFDTPCQSDNDCPEYSKCIKYQEGDNPISLCTYGTFLCPKTVDSYLIRKNNTYTCHYVNTDIYDIDIDITNSTNTKPILGICPPFNPRGDLQYRYEEDDDDYKYFTEYNEDVKCFTEKCSNDNDCFSGMCQNGVCINNIKADYIIYRCTGVFKQNHTTMKCAKFHGMECGSNEDCYTEVCNKGYCSTSHIIYISNDGRINFAIETKNQIILILLGLALTLLYI